MLAAFCFPLPAWWWASQFLHYDTIVISGARVLFVTTVSAGDRNSRYGKEAFVAVPPHGVRAREIHLVRNNILAAAFARLKIVQPAAPHGDAHPALVSPATHSPHLDELGAP